MPRLLRCRPSTWTWGARTNKAFNAMRGVFGIAALAAVFAAHGGCTTPASLADGFKPAAWVGAAVASSDW
jgi:hypothetical protein